MLGNPCTDWEHCKDYIIARLPWLKFLDGKEIVKSECILARSAPW